MTDIRAIRERAMHWPRSIGQASEDIDQLLFHADQQAAEIDRLNAVSARVKELEAALETIKASAADFSHGDAVTERIVRGIYQTARKALQEQPKK